MTKEQKNAYMREYTKTYKDTSTYKSIQKKYRDSEKGKEARSIICQKNTMLGKRILRLSDGRNTRGTV